MEVVRTGSTMFLGLVLCVIFPRTISHRARTQQCNIVPRSMSLPVLEKEGNVVLGGLFSLHDMVLEPTLSFTSTPPPKQCTRQAVGKLVNDDLTNTKCPIGVEMSKHSSFASFQV